MKLVIDIPDELYNYMCSEQPYDKHLDKRFDFQIRDTVKKGTPLPKGHGRLLDENDILDTDNNDGGWYDLVDMPEYIKGVKGIIEADKEE